MKKQISPNFQTHLLGRTFYLLLLIAFCVIPFALAERNATRPETSTKSSQRTLTFAKRVAYQRAIEEVYWRHRIWPKQRPDPKPSLDAVMSQAQLEKKVEGYLRDSQRLEDHWQRPINADQLQAEMERMATHTRQPEVLREIFEALGNDPFVIAECLARPVLADRFANGDPVATAPNAFGAAHPARMPPQKPALAGWLGKVERQVPVTMAAVSANYTLPAIASPSGGCIDDWTATSTTNAPSARRGHTAVWTGSEMIVWGGVDVSYSNTGGRYIPSTDSWTATSTTNAPPARFRHTAVWTGSEMIIWGGDDFSDLNTGGKYNPGSDSWTATSTTNAPDPRSGHTAVWTGSEMIVWGGELGIIDQNTGGTYNPNTDSWTATSTTNAPVARHGHTAVWTRSEMIVWGGDCGVTCVPFNSGGRYDPTTNSWVATSITNAPDARSGHTAVWSDSEMIVWGGFTFGQICCFYFNTGGRYDPSTDTWTATSTANAPSARASHTGVWTEGELIVWGGFDGSIVNSGGRYDPSTDVWNATSTANAPAARWQHTAVWSGSEMTVWGGSDESDNKFNTGGRYCAQSGSPTPTPTPSPTATATATATATPTATPSVTPRTSPTPRPHPTPRPRA